MGRASLAPPAATVHASQLPRVLPTAAQSIGATSLRRLTQPCSTAAAAAAARRHRCRCRSGALPARAMLLEHLPALEGRRIVLASASPRRRELLQSMGLKFEVVVSSFEETLPKDQYSAAEYAQHTAAHKALDVARVLAAQAAEAAAGGAAAAAAAPRQQRPTLVIGADTVVEYGEHVLEKPADAAEAAAVLRMLSGQRHHVHTGVALVLPPAEGSTDPQLHSFAVTTSVEFDQLSDATIAAYVASGEPFDKAGSYGIQGLAGSFVRGIEGCFFNVVGFPVNKFGNELGGLIERGALRLGEP